MFTPEEFQTLAPGVVLPEGKETAYCTAAETWVDARRLGRTVHHLPLLQEAKAQYVMHLLHVSGEFQKAKDAGLTVTVEGDGSVRRESSGIKQHADQAAAYKAEAESLIEKACQPPRGPFRFFAGVAR